jgi:membrane protease YdiL (CAAX protease family)
MMKPRAVAGIALFLLLAALAVLGYLFLLSVLRGKLGAFSAAVPALLLAVATLILNWRFLRSEGRSLADLGFDAPRVRIAQVALGFGAGTFTAGAWALALWGITSASWWIVPDFHPMAAAGSLTFIFFNNAAEELIYRGYLFLLLSRTYGRGVAIVSTSILFALLHVQGGVPWQSALAGVLTSALLFAVLFVRWESVPLVMAFHAGTNFMQELAGLRVTGLTLFEPRYSRTPAAIDSYSILALVAVINIALTLAVGLSIRRRRPATSSSRR